MLIPSRLAPAVKSHCLQDDNYEEAERLAQASASLGKKDRNPRRASDVTSLVS